MKETCKADPARWSYDEKLDKDVWYEGGPNYNQSHVPVNGLYDGNPRKSCLFCGKWLE